MAATNPRVAIIVPMYNAAATIDETLDSIIAQTYAEIEIIVIDDGSTDDGPTRVLARAVDEPRLGLIRQPNSGVAVARNAGAAAANADFLAFIDADDLWAPQKIELQMQVLLASNNAAGVAYSWFALIDRWSYIISLDNQPLVEGHVLQQLCEGNFVGNGSSLLIRRELFDRVGGYDRTLRDRDAQGCEDLAICLALSELTEFRVVPRFMTGYRITHDNMSSDVLRMRRSADLVLGTYGERFPLYRPLLAGNMNGLTEWLLHRAVQARKLMPATLLYRKLLRSELKRTLRITPYVARSYLRATAAHWLRSSHDAVNAGIAGRRQLYRDGEW